jgi:hypothetical protein
MHVKNDMAHNHAHGASKVDQLILLAITFEKAKPFIPSK